MQEIIHVVLAVYDPSGKYSQNAGVVMASIFENTGSKVTVHILHDETLTQDNRQKFIRTAEKYSQNVEFHDVSLYTEKLGDKLAKISEQWTIGTLYRMFIPEVLCGLEKVIYLDCDVLVNLDIKELWEISLDGKSLAAVRDNIYWWVKPFSGRGVMIWLIGGQVKDYINAGVTVMDLERFREMGDFSARSCEWLEAHSHLPLFPDQDALNSMFFGDIKFLDAKFNVYELDGDLSGCIVHMYAHKPWKGFRGMNHERMFWKYFLMSAWGEDMTREELIDRLGDGAKAAESSLREELKPGFRLKFSSRYVDIARLLCKDVYHRLKRKFSH